MDTRTQRQEPEPQPDANLTTQPIPAIERPTGGGAIRGIDEKFQVNPATGSGAMTVPITTSPGRAGFGPQLALSYDSGGGNGPFGLGWSLSTPNITRKTDRGLPQYRDHEESDVFILSGAEDLVPTLIETDRGWDLDVFNHASEPYSIQRYRPRVEGLFARIERWMHRETGDIHWRSMTPDNITTLYGRTAESRIADPSDLRRVFSWLICESYDDKGNAILYRYQREETAGVPLFQVHERNRTDQGRSANRYLKCIHYGNRTRHLPGEDLRRRTDWMFEVLFDYGEGHYEEFPPDAQEQRFVRSLLTPPPDTVWPTRQDSFSTYRAGFELRTYRLCRRVLMFHHFPEELGAPDDLVRSTDFTYDEGPVATYLTAITHSGYVRQADGSYLKKSMPPVAFTYSRVPLQDGLQPEDTERLRVREIDPDSLDHLPMGLDGSQYRFVDLDGEGLSGILTEQGDAWFYKPNLGQGRFGDMLMVAQTPSLAALNEGQQQLLDLAGDGQLDLVMLNGPTSGFYEREADASWSALRAFQMLPNLSWNDPNLRFVDLTGDGHADVLITEDQVLSWYPSRAEEGFGPAERVSQALDEEHGPRLVFADGTSSVYLADLSGDGLTDLVRIRNGEVSYWPNLGYGRFGAKVTMDDAPWFDAPDVFDQRRIRLADVDGSGIADILYLGRDGVDLYFNQAGNAWSPRTTLPQFPHIDNLASIQVVDLLGSGTACLVWSSPLPHHAHQPLYYIDLMNGTKPHLLIKSENNLGAETVVQYAPSTKFYIADKLAGTPWLTRLPFPVYVVEQVDITDHITGSTYGNRYAYHHGYFDGYEREFRGFGMIEQWDTDRFSDDHLDQPPVYTKTWFHTGVYLGHETISHQYAGEYYREPDLSDDQFAASLLPDTQLPADLTPEETLEACRALKGTLLRQETYALDGGSQQSHPYVVSENASLLRRLQPKQDHRHAVFLAYLGETLDYHYERDPQDSRMSHRLTLEVDDFGHVTKMVAVGYPRRTQPGLPDEQRRPYLTYTENRFANVADEVNWYRVGVPIETKTYELHNIPLPGGRQRYAIEGLLEEGGIPTTEIFYHDTPGEGTAQKRLVEHQRTLYLANDLRQPLGFENIESLALPFKSYTLTFTQELLNVVYGDRINDSLLKNEGRYVKSEDLKTAGLFPTSDADDAWWMPSARVFFSPDPNAPDASFAQDNFYLPQGSMDPFGETLSGTAEHVTRVTYDVHRLLVIETRDPLDPVTTPTPNLSNVVKADYDYRVLQPKQVTDPNGNHSQVAFDALGMVVGTALMGKDGEAFGDHLRDFTPDFPTAVLRQPLRDPLRRATGRDAHALLGSATSRMIYDVHRFSELGEAPVVYTLDRETHVSDLDGEPTKIQHRLLYSDGLGRQFQTKIQAEPGPIPCLDILDEVSPRWVGTGRTIYNNKGNPVKQYEPFFSPTHLIDTDEVLIACGVTPLIYYDPIDRVIRTEHPDGSVSRVTFTPWEQQSYDANDTVLDPGNAWYMVHGSPDPTGAVPREPRERTAYLAAQHANTPTTSVFDTLGRPFLSLQDNHDDHLYRTHTRLDIEGNPLLISDDRDNPVMDYRIEISLDRGGTGFVPGYDVAGRQLYQKSMDAGERWVLMNVAGNPIRTWDSRGHTFRTAYDPLQRPTHQYLHDDDGAQVLLERIVYGDGAEVSTPELNNLRGQIHQHYDPAGVLASERYDFKGNLLVSRRQLARHYRPADRVDGSRTDHHTVDWSVIGSLSTMADIQSAAAGQLEATLPYETRTSYDALNRATRITTPDGSETLPVFNEANLLEAVRVRIRGASEARDFVRRMSYNARGQRTFIEYVTDPDRHVCTTYEYDEQTFRLTGLTTRRDTDTLLQDLHYTYDPVGNITYLRDHAQQVTYFRNAVVRPDASYEYDALYRLVAAEGREHIGQVSRPQVNHDDRPRMHHPLPSDGAAMRRYVEQYLYDSVGNILAMIHQLGSLRTPGTVIWNRRYQYHTSNNQLVSTSLPGEPEAPSYSITPGYHDTYPHDVHGNMTAMPHLQSLAWNYRDQPQMTQRQAVTEGIEPERTYYVYNTAGQRVRKVTVLPNGNRKNERIYLEGYELYREYDSSGNSVTLERQTLHVMDDQHRIALVETKTIDTDAPAPAPTSRIRYQFGNHLGSACLELDGAGEMISYEEYHPYGSTAYQAVDRRIEVSAKRYRYTGMERDEETGLNYHAARYYAMWLGRWCSADPIGIQDGFNVYGYVKGNPKIFRDVVGTQTDTATVRTPLDMEDDEVMSRARDRFNIPSNIEERRRRAARIKRQGRSDLYRALDAWGGQGLLERVRSQDHAAIPRIEILRRQVSAAGGIASARRRVQESVEEVDRGRRSRLDTALVLSIMTFESNMSPFSDRRRDIISAGEDYVTGGRAGFDNLWTQASSSERRGLRMRAYTGPFLDTRGLTPAWLPERNLFSGAIIAVDAYVIDFERRFNEVMESLTVTGRSIHPIDIEQVHSGISDDAYRAWIQLTVGRPARIRPLIEYFISVYGTDPNAMNNILTEDENTLSEATGVSVIAIRRARATSALAWQIEHDDTMRQVID